MDDWRDPSGRVVVTEMALPATWVGTEYAQVERLTGTRVVSVNRYGEGNLVMNTPVVQIDDIVHVAAPSVEWSRIKRIIAAGPQGS
jgi:trk system potassium uptake protein TrkA